MKAQCIACENVIYHPICNDCFTERVNAWLPELELKLMGLPGKTQCLLCGKNTGICIDCFRHDAFGQIALKNKNLAKEFIAEFDLVNEVLI